MRDERDAISAHDIAARIVHENDVVGAIVIVLGRDGGLDISLVADADDSSKPLTDIADVVRLHCDGEFQLLEEDGEPPRN